MRNALNRGTAVYLRENFVRFVWACGCTKDEGLTAPGGARYSSVITRKLVSNWRNNGVVLEQCTLHPNHYEKLSPLPRLNQEHPNEPRS